MRGGDSQRAFSAAAADKPITFDIDMPFTTHNIDGPDLKVTTSKSTFTRRTPSLPPQPTTQPQHRDSALRTTSRTCERSSSIVRMCVAPSKRTFERLNVTPHPALPQSAKLIESAVSDGGEDEGS